MSNTLKFFIKRVLVVYLVLLTACFFVKHHRLPMLIILTVSVVFSLVRFAVLESVLKHLGEGTNKTVAVVLNLVIYLFNLGIVTITFVLAVRFGVYTLLAALTGTLSVMIVIVLNTITETLGITKNQFGEKVI